MIAAGDTCPAGSEGGEKIHSHNYGVEYGVYFGLVSGNNGYAIASVDYSSDGSSQINPGENVTQRNFAINGVVQPYTKNYDCNTFRTNTKTSYATSYPPYLSIYMWKRIE